MRLLLFVVAAVAALFGIAAGMTARSDIQIGIAANAVFSAVIMVGLASLIGRIAK